MLTLSLTSDLPFAFPQWSSRSCLVDGTFLESNPPYGRVVPFMCPGVTYTLFPHRLFNPNTFAHGCSEDVALDLILSVISNKGALYNEQICLDGALLMTQERSTSHRFIDEDAEARRKCLFDTKTPWLISSGVEDADVHLHLGADAVTSSGKLTFSMDPAAFFSPHLKPDSNITANTRSLQASLEMNATAFLFGAARSWAKRHPASTLYHDTPVGAQQAWRDLFIQAHIALGVPETSSTAFNQYSRDNRIRSRLGSPAQRREAAEDIFDSVFFLLINSGWTTDKGWAPTAWAENPKIWAQLETQPSREAFEMGMAFGQEHDLAAVHVLSFLQDTLQHYA